MLKKIIYSLLCFIPIFAFSQNEARQWHFGSSRGLNFLTNPPSLVLAAYGNTSISDGAGNFLFSPRSGSIYNPLGLQMANSLGIQINGIYDQSNIIVKQPGSASIYYIFSTSYLGLTYSIVDMSLAAGMGSVTVKNFTVNNVPVGNSIAATKHCNGQDIWIMTRESVSLNYHAYLLSSSGLNSTAVISSVGLYYNYITYGMKFSPSGKKLASTSDEIELCDFNTNTGVLSNIQSIGILSTLQTHLSSVEFSLDESKLYASGRTNGIGTPLNNFVFQWNLCAGTTSAISASHFTLGTMNNIEKKSLQLAPDGKIYVGRDGGVHLGVIHSPNLAGTACNYVEQGLSLTLSNSYNGNLPTFVSSYFYNPQKPAAFTNSLNLLQSCRSVSFTAPANPSTNCSASNYSVTGFKWFFGDPSTGSANSSTLANPVHEYSAPGTYTAMYILTYACGADTLRQPITISGPSLSVSNSTVTCASFGSATVLATGGTGPYSYTWSPAAQNSSVAVNLNSGNYSVSVFDTGAGCLISASTSIGSNYVFTGTVSSNNLLCHSANNATAAIQVSGGSGANTYSWSGSVQSTSLVGALAAGVYSVTVTDQLSLCSLTQTFQVTQPTALSLNIAASSASNCVGNSINLTANSSGGIPGYSYTWVGGPAQALYTVAEPLSGTYIYTVNVTDANGCLATNTKTLVFTGAPVLVVNSATICSGYTASLSVSGANSYTWQPGAFVGSGFTASPASTKVYSITGYIAGCLSTNAVQATITVVSAPSLSIALSSNTLCAQAFNGSPNTLTLTSGGASSYTLQTPDYIGNSNPSGPSSPLNIIPPYTSGPATATLVGSNGYCTVANTVSFMIIPNPTISVSSPTPFICAGQSFTYTSNGASSYTWSGSTPGITTYSTGSVAVAHPSINSVFSVYGGSLGCNSALQSHTLTVKPLPLINLMPASPTVCIGSKVRLSASGTATSYTWSPLMGLSSATGATVDAAPSAQQSYTVTGSLNNCNNSAALTVSLLPLPQPEFSILKPELCANELVNFKGSGGSFYEWKTPGNYLYSGSTASFVAQNTGFSGNYTLTVTDSTGCKASSIKYLLVHALPHGYLKGNYMQKCVPFESDFIFYPAANTNSLTAAQWDIKSVSTTSQHKGNQFTGKFNIAGTYSITGTFTDPGTQCVNRETFFVEAYPLPVADFIFSPEKPVENLEEVIFTNTSTGEELNKWDWFFENNNGFTSSAKNPAYLFTEAGIYPIAMVVGNSWGCKDTVVKSLVIEADLGIYIPNAFSPNGDNLNEFFVPVLRGVKKYDLDVYNRWGTKLYSGNELHEGWDGTYKGEACKVDSYVWKLVLKTLAGESKILSGHVILSR